MCLYKLLRLIQAIILGDAEPGWVEQSKLQTHILHCSSLVPLMSHNFWRIIFVKPRMWGLYAPFFLTSRISIALALKQ